MRGGAQETGGPDRPVRLPGATRPVALITGPTSASLRTIANRVGSPNDRNNAAAAAVPTGTSIAI